MRKECAAIVIINLEGIKSQLNAIMINYMHVDCAKIATLIDIIKYLFLFYKII
jgi:hypothetical protein